MCVSLERTKMRVPASVGGGAWDATFDQARRAALASREEAVSRGSLCRFGPGGEVQRLRGRFLLRTAEGGVKQLLVVAAAL